LFGPETDAFWEALKETTAEIQFSGIMDALQTYVNGKMYFVTKSEQGTTVGRTY
jgi:hypothetical protein